MREIYQSRDRQNDGRVNASKESHGCNRSSGPVRAGRQQAAWLRPRCLAAPAFVEFRTRDGDGFFDAQFLTFNVVGRSAEHNMGREKPPTS